MKTLLIAVALVLVASPVFGSIVIQDGTSVIVASTGYHLLTMNGEVWRTDFFSDPVWERKPELDLPMPVEDVLFWDVGRLITKDFHFWAHWSLHDTWVDCGPCPCLPASIDDETDPRSLASIAPNPSTGSCRIAFSAVSEGPISVEIVDVSGRVVRRLLKGSMPAGDYRLLWDGRDDSGRDVAAGAYFTRIETGEGVASGRVTLAR